MKYTFNYFYYYTYSTTVFMSMFNRGPFSRHGAHALNLKRSRSNAWFKDAFQGAPEVILDESANVDWAKMGGEYTGIISNIPIFTHEQIRLDQMFLLDHDRVFFTSIEEPNMRRFGDDDYSPTPLAEAILGCQGDLNNLIGKAIHLGNIPETPQAINRYCGMEVEATKRFLDQAISNKRPKKMKKSTVDKLKEKVEVLNHELAKLQREIKDEEDSYSAVNSESSYRWKQSDGEIVDLRTDRVNNFHLVNILNSIIEKSNGNFGGGLYTFKGTASNPLERKIPYILSEIYKRKLTLWLK